MHVTKYKHYSTKEIQSQHLRYKHPKASLIASVWSFFQIYSSMWHVLYRSFVPTIILLVSATNNPNSFDSSIFDEHNSVTRGTINPTVRNDRYLLCKKWAFQIFTTFWLRKECNRQWSIANLLCVFFNHMVGSTTTYIIGNTVRIRM